MSNSVTPWTVAHPTLCPSDFPGKNTGVGFHSYSRGSSWPRDQTLISCFSCTVRQILYHCANWEAPYTWIFFSINTTVLHNHKQLNLQIQSCIRSGGGGIVAKLCLTLWIWKAVNLYVHFWLGMELRPVTLRLFKHQLFIVLPTPCGMLAVHTHVVLAFQMLNWLLPKVSNT